MQWTPIVLFFFLLLWTRFFFDPHFIFSGTECLYWKAGLIPLSSLSCKWDRILRFFVVWNLVTFQYLTKVTSLASTPFLVHTQAPLSHRHWHNYFLPQLLCSCCFLISLLSLLPLGVHPTPKCLPHCSVVFFFTSKILTGNPIRAQKHHHVIYIPSHNHAQISQKVNEICEKCCQKSVSKF